MTSTHRPLLPKGPLQPLLGEDLSVKIVGIGGVGGIVARYGAVFLASLAESQQKNVREVLIDGDEFEPGNRSRMLFSGYGNKAAVTRADLLERFVDSRLSLVAMEEYVTAQNASRLFHNGDVIITSVDNHATRKLISDFCAQHLDDAVLISGGNDGMGLDAKGKERRGTYGNCQVYVRRGGQDLSPSLTEFHAEIANPADRLPTDQSCTEAIASAPQLLLANLAAASAILNALWLHLCEALTYSELAFDIAEGLMSPMPLPGVCYDHPIHSSQI